MVLKYGLKIEQMTNEQETCRSTITFYYFFDIYNFNVK